MTDFVTEMDQLAAEIAKAAREDKTDLDIKIDAFKALMPYYAYNKKLKDKDVDGDLPNFNNFQSNIHAAAEQADGSDEPRVRDSRRNGS